RPLYTAVHLREPSTFNGRSHQLRGQRPSSAGPQVSIDFSWAPSGTSPVYTAVHLREPSTFQRALAPAPGPPALLGRPSGLHRFHLGTVRHQPGLHISPPPRS